MRNPLTILTMLLAVLMATSAQAEGWIVSKVSQPASFTTDRTNWSPLEKGMKVPDSAWIHTGRRGRAVLTHERDTLTINPETLTGIFARDKRGEKFTVAQQIGSILVDFEHRPGRKLDVQTPFLAAVVKGTRFGVKVDDQKARLSVERGLVGVTSPTRGEHVDVAANQSVSVEQGAKGSISVTGPGAKSPVSKVAVTASRVETVAATTERAEAERAAEAETADNSANGAPSSAGNPGKGKETGKSGGKGNSGKGGGHGKSDGQGKGNSGHGHGNSGHGNSGHGNSGSGNSGNGNSGNGNSGHGNGNGNSGNGNGNGNSEHGNSGHGEGEDD